jgi:L-fuculose-phosphate aldolase
MNPANPHAASVAKCMRRIYAQQLTTTSGGNVSVRDASDAIWITGSGIDKATICATHVIGVAADGSRHPDNVDSCTKPSSELPFHRAIYDVRPDVHAIVHAHSAALVSTTLVGRVPDLRLIPSAFLICGDVAWTEYTLPGTNELGRRLAAVFAQGHNSALMQNHGVVVGGADLSSALCRFETLELTTRSIDAASELGEPRSSTPESLQVYKQVMRPHNTDEGPSPRQDSVTKAICEIMRRGYQRHLMVNGRGSISVRIGANSFLISRPGCDFAVADVSQLIRRPLDDRFQREHHDWHRQLYQAHAEIGAIIHSYPPFATSFGLLDRPFTAATIPESYMVLRNVARCSPCEPQRQDAVAATLNLDSPVAIVDRDGALVVGRTLLEAFDRLEVLEATAESIVRASRLGDVRLLGDDELRDLADLVGP